MRGVFPISNLLMRESTDISSMMVYQVSVLDDCTTMLRPLRLYRVGTNCKKTDIIFKPLKFFTTPSQCVWLWTSIMSILPEIIKDFLMVMLAKRLKYTILNKLSPFGEIISLTCISAWLDRNVNNYLRKSEAKG